MEYPQIGIEGTAYKTQALKKNALVHFNLFLESKGLPNYELIEEEQICDISLFREFGYYLAFHARSSKTEELLMCGTAMTYISAIKEQVMEFNWLNSPNINIFCGRFQESFLIILYSKKLTCNGTLIYEVDWNVI